MNSLVGSRFLVIRVNVIVGEGFRSGVVGLK